MTILHLICSPRGRASQSFWLSQQIVDCLLQRDPGATVITRMIGDGSLAHVDALQAAALGANQPTPVERFPEGSMLVSEELIEELERADIVVIGTPMHNFTVPSGLKAWIDHIVRVRRTFDVSPGGKIPLLRDRPIFVAVSSGARYSGERVRQPDFLTPYLKAILATVGLHDLRFFSVEGTGSSAERFAAAQARTEQALQAYFSGAALPRKFTPHGVIPAQAGTSVGDVAVENGGSRLRGNDPVDGQLAAIKSRV